MISKSFYVYSYSHPITGQIFYIGKGKNNRLNSHWARRNNHYNTLLKSILLDLDRAGLKPIIIKVKSKLDNFESFLLEHELIKKYGRIGIDDGGILCNRSIGFEHCNAIRDIENLNRDDLKKYLNQSSHFNLIYINEEEKTEICP
jgi:hypothetical protein